MSEASSSMQSIRNKLTQCRVAELGCNMLKVLAAE